jgi:ribonuclease E
MTADRDPWADLAESLGAAQSPEPQPQRPVEPSRPRPSQQPPRPRPRSAADSNWDSLVSDLGIAGDRTGASETPRPSQEPAPPRRTAGDRPAAEGRVDARSDTAAGGGWANDILADTGDRADRPSREPDESGEGRERRGRRRRGRRGGRGGRGGRDENRGEARGPVDQEGRRSSPGGTPDEFNSHGEAHGQPAATGVDSGARRGDFAGDVLPPSPEATDEEGDRPARRRRRGRRGGRRRGRSTRERLAGERLAAEKPESEKRIEEVDDEPLATGYGAIPRSAGSARTETERSANGGESERRGRRRRRGSGEPRPATPRRESNQESGRRRGSDAPRSGSRSDRGRRRDDFTPVAGRFDEDDEGLEFLGVEEAGRTAAAPRDRRPTSEDDSIAESGLDTVREVPSWVEAIGIVIASNLDARNKSAGGRK